MTTVLEQAATSDPDRLGWDDLVAEGKVAVEIADGLQWRLGDIAAQVEVVYGERDLQKYADLIGINYDTLRDYRDVAQRFAGASRNYPLAWNSFRSLGRLDILIRDDWVKRALASKWSVSRVRREVAEFLNAPAEKSEPQAGKKRLGMKAVPNRKVTLFRDIADAFETLIEQEEREYAEPEQIAMSLDSDARSEIERALARAEEFMGKWRRILELQDAILNPATGPNEDGIEHVRDEDWPPREEAV